MKDEKYYSDAGRDERLRSELIALFRGFGYDRYRMAKFESYDVYLKNKDYIVRAPWWAMVTFPEDITAQKYRQKAGRAK